MRDTRPDAVLGCIAGGAIGDAAGSAFEGRPAGSDPRPLLGADGHLTHDTQLTLATCEAIIERGAPHPEHIAASLLRWFRNRRVTGMGASTLKALRDLEAGAHWALAGRRGERAAGNGAAMRIAPLAFCVDGWTDESRRLIRDVCRITHHHDEAYAGALAVVLAVWRAKNGGQSLEWVASRLPYTAVGERLLAYAALPVGESLVEAARRFGNSGYVVESVPLALFAAQKVAALGFSDMLEQLIAAGGDTDTNASIAGQVAGTALGLSGLPAELVEKLPQGELVLGIARSFAESIVRQVEPYFVITRTDSPILELCGDGTVQACQELLHELQDVFGARYSKHLDGGNNPDNDKEHGYWHVDMFGQEFFVMRSRGHGICLWGPKPPADISGFIRVAAHFGARERMSPLKRIAYWLGLAKPLSDTESHT
jgi:ADP-ribosylglycohydrolase